MLIEWKKEQDFTKEALGQVYDKVAYFAEQEGLRAHERSMTIRFEEEENE